MKLRILVVAIFSLIVVACDKSNNAAPQTSAAKSASNTQVTKVSETPVSVEAVKTAEDTVAATETNVQANEQTDNPAIGETVYKKSCMSCHMTGVAGAPKVGDASAWESRIAKGAAALVESAISGVPGTAMMARGTCGACSDDDIKAAVDYMVAQSR